MATTQKIAGEPQLAILFATDEQRAVAKIERLSRQGAADDADSRLHARHRPCTKIGPR